MTPNSENRRNADFDELYARYGREVWAVAYSRRMDRDAAMDIAQESFLRFWNEREKGTEILNPRGWLIRVARNLADDTAKSAFRRHGTTATNAMDGYRSLAKPPDMKLLQDETFACVRAVMEELVVSDRDILTLRYALDYDSPKIAEILEIPVTSVHMRLSRARKRLAEKFLERGVEPLS